ncbi:MAG: Zn-dependent hydrolase [Rhodospirillales bacterium]|nr:Zn-dependent hydrolase [Rhodospirillales bacterium]
MNGGASVENLRIDGKRLWDSLMELAQIGATGKGGVCRLALTDPDRQGRDLFVRWCREAGCSLEVDAVGNIFARRPGRNAALPAVMTGSHLDSQPTGGKFDGAYGVMAGLEVLRSLNDLGIETEAPVELAVWTNEEGCRFAPAMMGSGAYAGVFTLEETLARRDGEGVSYGEALDAIGYRGAGLGGRPVAAYFEAHIEQGPILEAEGKTIGVVTGAQGQRWYEVTLTGQEAHAGPTPMARRRDALVGASRVVSLVNRLGLAHRPDACATVGMLEVHPNSRNVIPGRVWLTVDLRHPEDGKLQALCAEFERGTRAIAAAGGLELNLKEIWHSPARPFTGELVSAVRSAAERGGFSYRDMVSGAGHDAVYMARVAPAAMIFVPCAGGISHNESESATPGDLAAGCNVLLHAMLERAGVCGARA